MEEATILILDSGARGHVLAKAYEKSKDVKKIIVAPGNDFISFNAKKETIADKNCSLKNLETILDISKKYNPDLIDVAQDDALGIGAVNFLQYNGFNVFGPVKNASKIESDKIFSRGLCASSNIPCPGFKSFNSEGKAISYVQNLYSDNSSRLIFVKAQGLCSGKGALSGKNLSMTISNIKKMKEFETAGKNFLIEEGLVGEEFSFFAICDGKTFKTFKSAQDNKLLYNFDNGPQTGGMGGHSPALVTKNLEFDIKEKFIQNTLMGLNNRRIKYCGILYASGMLSQNKIFLIEHNARWGDPEAQTILSGYKGDYFNLVQSCLNQTLAQTKIDEDDLTRVCIVGSSRGYPYDYNDILGKRIFGIEEAVKLKDIEIFGAGIEMEDGKFYVNGGRLFSVVGSGKNILEARQKAYEAISLIHVEGNNLHYRTDIGFRDVERFLTDSFNDPID
ncbi:MAG: phosphoribosylamine--glycine ligase [Nanoarchaeota archaeon]